VEPQSRTDAPSTPFHQWLPLVFMLPHLFASLLKKKNFIFSSCFFFLLLLLYVQREEEKWGLL